MNKTLLVAAFGLVAAAVCSPASAQTATGTGNANSSSSSGAVAIGGGGGSASASGGDARIIFNTPGSTESRVRQTGSLRTTGSAIAPGLGAAGVETCYGPGVSGGVGFVGGAVSFGMGQFDQDCNARLYSRTLYAMGQKNAALQLLVNESPMVQRAYGVGRGGAAVTNRGIVYGDQGTASRGSMFSGCRKWSGGATGVGSCLY